MSTGTILLILGILALALLGWYLYSQNQANNSLFGSNGAGTNILGLFA